MEFIHINLRAIGPPSKKQQKQISTQFMLKITSFGGKNWTFRDQPGWKEGTPTQNNHVKVHYKCKQLVFDEKKTSAKIALNHPILTQCVSLIVVSSLPASSPPPTCPDSRCVCWAPPLLCCFFPQLNHIKDFLQAQKCISSPLFLAFHCWWLFGDLFYPPEWN